MVATLNTARVIWTYSRREDRRPSTRNRVQHNPPPRGVTCVQAPTRFPAGLRRIATRFSNLSGLSQLTHDQASRDEGWGSQIRRYGRAGAVHGYSGAALRGSGPSGGRSAAHRFVVGVHPGFPRLSRRRLCGCHTRVVMLCICVSIDGRVVASAVVRMDIAVRAASAHLRRCAASSTGRRCLSACAACRLGVLVTTGPHHELATPEHV